MKIERGFTVNIEIHTKEALKSLDPKLVRFVIGDAFDRLRLQEEIDYTLKVARWRK